MVIFATCNNPEYIIYLGKDKYENEELIKYGLPIDIWFHVENLSSAHVYLRFPEGVTLDTIDKVALNDCLQIVKDGSKDGRKKEKVSVCYTSWENLKKTQSMEVGEVGFKDDKLVRVANNISKDRELLRELKKTFVEKEINFQAEKESYNKEQANKRKKQLEDEKKNQIEQIKMQKLLNKEKHFEYIDDLGEAHTNKEGADLEDDFW